MSDMKFIVEELSPKQASIVTESTVDGKNCWLSGIFMQGDVRNKNGRVYHSSVLNEAVDKAKTIISERNGIMGELDHPESMTINLDRVSHIITDLYMEGSNAIGKAKLLNTPLGNIAKELILNNVSLGVSSRGAGSIDANGNINKFCFVTVDIVAQPSAPNAYPSAVYESLSHSRNGNKILNLAEAVVHDNDAQKYFKREILNWLNTGLFSKK